METVSGGITVFGASGHAKVVLDILELSRVRIDLIVDDNAALHGREFYGYVVGGGRAQLQESLSRKGYLECIIAIGNNRIRGMVAKWLLEAGAVLAPAALHPSAQVSRTARISRGCVVMAGCVVNPDAYIGENVIINTGASVDHDCIVGQDVHVAPGATLCGGVHLGEGSMVGAGSVVHPNITIGKNVTIGAGATVLEDVPDNVTVVGTPARRIL
jgi:sugar O-acyltransferase (sialic acid O-acetyltransferase NeuD family)